MSPSLASVSEVSKSVKKAQPKKPKRLKRWLLTIAVFLVIAAVVIVAALWLAGRNTYKVQPAPSVAEATPALRGPNDTGTVPDVEAAVAQAAANPALGNLAAQVTDLVSNTVVWNKSENQPMVPASSTKVLTAGAALLTLPNDQREVTTVTETKPGTLVLSSTGDVTLATEPGKGFFTDPATISDLAGQVKKSLGDQKVSEIIVDNSVRSRDVFNSTWDPQDIDGGNVADLDAVMLNAGRLDPSDPYSPRSRSPGEDVGEALASALGATGATVTLSDSAQDTQQGGNKILGTVKSAPLDVRLRDMMIHSDNLLAESIGRDVAAAMGNPTTFAGAAEATLEALKNNGYPTENVTLKDNSGMSKDNRLTATALNGVLAGEKTREILDLLPVSSAEGTLANRYGSGSGAEAAAGWVRAKTGTLSGVSALVGTIMTADGRPLTFAFLSNGSEVDAARTALDQLAASLHNAKSGAPATN